MVKKAEQQNQNPLPEEPRIDAIQDNILAALDEARKMELGLLAYLLQMALQELIEGDTFHA